MSAGDKIDDMEAHIEKLDLELIRLRTKMEQHQETVLDIDTKLDSIRLAPSTTRSDHSLIQRLFKHRNSCCSRFLRAVNQVCRRVTISIQPTVHKPRQ